MYFKALRGETTRKIHEQSLTRQQLGEIWRLPDRNTNILNAPLDFRMKRHSSAISSIQCHSLNLPPDANLKHLLVKRKHKWHNFPASLVSDWLNWVSIVLMLCSSTSRASVSSFSHIRLVCRGRLKGCVGLCFIISLMYKHNLKIYKHKIIQKYTSIWILYKLNHVTYVGSQHYIQKCHRVWADSFSNVTLLWVKFGEFKGEVDNSREGGLIDECCPPNKLSFTACLHQRWIQSWPTLEEYRWKHN